jgi:hypothetical protein
MPACGPARRRAARQPPAAHEDRIQQLALLDGLRQERRKCQLLPLGEAPADRRERDDRHVARGGLAPDALRGRDAVDVRHLHVEQHEVEGLAAVHRMRQEVEGLVAAGGERRPATPALQRLQQHHAVRGVVVDHQDAEPREPDLVRHLRRRLGDFERGREPERAPAPRRALDADRAAHHRHQALTDRQAEAGAAVAPRRRAVGLG